MTVSELKSHIENNVYENTSGAITGGILQDVIENLAACILGYASSSSGAAKLPTSESADVMAKLIEKFTDKALGSLASDTKSLLPRLGTNYNFGYYLGSNPGLWNLVNVGSQLAANSGLYEGIKSHMYGVGQYIWSDLTYNQNFCWAMASILGYTEGADSTSLAYCLANNASFVSWMKQKLGL